MSTENIRSQNRLIQLIILEEVERGLITDELRLHEPPGYLNFFLSLGQQTLRGSAQEQPTGQPLWIKRPCVRDQIELDYLIDNLS
jgi:hypothetical protein